MKLAYFDCFSGISGDMTLGALVDAGCDVERLRADLRGLQVPGWELSAEKVWKNGMAATYVKVKTENQSKHRSLGAIHEILQKSRLPPRVRERAAAIFTKLGEAASPISIFGGRSSTMAKSTPYFSWMWRASASRNRFVSI